MLDFKNVRSQFGTGAFFGGRSKTRNENITREGYCGSQVCSKKERLERTISGELAAGRGSDVS